MELREISLYEARMNDLPASEPGEGEVCIWYALDDNEEYKGSEISIFLGNFFVYFY